jgi:hypothetical protein
MSTFSPDTTVVAVFVTSVVSSRVGVSLTARSTVGAGAGSATGRPHSM